MLNAFQPYVAAGITTVVGLAWQRGLIRNLDDRVSGYLPTAERAALFGSEHNAPITWDRELGGYRFDAPLAAAPRFELPGLWFNEREIHALLSMQLLLTDMEPEGLVADQAEPLLARLNAMLGAANDSADEVRKKVLMVGVGRRPLPMAHFQELGHALLKGLRVKIRYAARSTGQTTEREISPLRLVHYRENWYLDAWCHLRQEIRNFSVDMVQAAQTLNQPAKRVAQQRIDQAAVAVGLVGAEPAAADRVEQDRKSVV